MNVFLEFERGIADLEGKIEELRQIGAKEAAKDAAKPNGLNIDDEIAKLKAKTDQLIAETYERLTPWQKTLVARHPARPHFSDYVAKLISEFTPLAGDRLFGEDRALVAGLGRFRGRAVAIVGHEKGNDTKSRLKHNFGMAMPEGYRKVQRLFAMADRFGLPVISLVDTAGAYPGVGAEERGQAEAIARTTQACLSLHTPFVAVIIGEGGSGGAVAIATANKVLMLEHAIYSVISPEGCASILWKSADMAPEAAETLGITANRLKTLGLVDKVVSEPLGGAHRDPQAAAQTLKKALAESLRQLREKKPKELVEERLERLMSHGRFKEAVER